MLREKDYIYVAMMLDGRRIKKYITKYDNKTTNFCVESGKKALSLSFKDANQLCEIVRNGGVFQVVMMRVPKYYYDMDFEVLYNC